ncbi:MAG TPA: hypothetical protein PLN89_02030 [Elusimicrobiota bacterium]|nr:hypothetical protein [Elusimicrobiota bacterium]
MNQMLRTLIFSIGLCAFFSCRSQRAVESITFETGFSRPSKWESIQFSSDGIATQLFGSYRQNKTISETRVGRFDPRSLNLIATLYSKEKREYGSAYVEQPIPDGPTYRISIRRSAGEEKGYCYLQTLTALRELESSISWSRQEFGSPKAGGSADAAAGGAADR